MSAATATIFIKNASVTKIETTQVQWVISAYALIKTRVHVTNQQAVQADQQWFQKKWISMSWLCAICTYIESKYHDMFLENAWIFCIKWF